MSGADGLKLLAELGLLEPEFDLDAALRQIEATETLKKRRHENPWARDLIRVLWRYPRGGRRLVIIEEVWHLRQATNLPVPRKFEHTVQSIFNHHSSQSTVWNGKQEDDIFYSREGKGSGIWAVHRDRAEAWLRRRALPDA